MHCFFYIACFLALLQSAFSVPTVAPRAEVNQGDASKGQSQQEFFGGLGGLGLGGYGLGLGGYGLGYGGLLNPYGYGLLGGYGSLYGGAFINPYTMYAGGLLFKKDAPNAGTNHDDISVSLR